MSESTQIQYLEKPSEYADEALNLRGIYQRDFRIFAKLTKLLNTGEHIPKELKLDFDSTSNNCKKSLMRSVWDEKWGDYSGWEEEICEIGCF